MQSVAAVGFNLLFGVFTGDSLSLETAFEQFPTDVLFYGGRLVWQTKIK